MISLIIAIQTTTQKRDALLKDIESQNFPHSALQVVLTSQKEELFSNLPEMPFDLRVVRLAEKRLRPVMIDIAIRQASGDFLYILDENSIFDNPDDLLKLYELFLERPKTDVCLGYNIRHRMYEPKNRPPQILSSEVMPTTGETNICLRRNVIESGFSFRNFLFGENPLEELEAMRMHIEKLKWLQVHQKVNVAALSASYYRAADALNHQWQSFVQSQLITQSRHRTLQAWNSELMQKSLVRMDVSGQKMSTFSKKWVRLVYQFVKVYALQGKVLAQRWASTGYMMAKKQYALGVGWAQNQLAARRSKPQLPSASDKVYVPHLQSSDQPVKKQPINALGESQLKMPLESDASDLTNQTASTALAANSVAKATHPEMPKSSTKSSKPKKPLFQLRDRQ